MLATMDMRAGLVHVRPLHGRIQRVVPDCRRAAEGFAVMQDAEGYRYACVRARHAALPSWPRAWLADHTRWAVGGWWESNPRQSAAAGCWCGSRCTRGRAADRSLCLGGALNQSPRDTADPRKWQRRTLCDRGLAACGLRASSAQRRAQTADRCCCCCCLCLYKATQRFRSCGCAAFQALKLLPKQLRRLPGTSLLRDSKKTG